MSNNTRSVGLNIRRRINEIYSAVAPIKAAADTWNLEGAENLLPSDVAILAALNAFEALEITPLRLFEEIQEIKTGTTEPPISGQVVIGWDNINPKPTAFEPTTHTHNYAQATHAHDETEPWCARVGYQAFANYHASAVVLFPAGLPPDYLLEGLRTCDGTEISRTCPAGYCLEALGFPFGIGNGSTTCNLPTITAPVGFEYRMFVGEGA